MLCGFFHRILNRQNTYHAPKQERIYLEIYFISALLHLKYRCKYQHSNPFIIRGFKYVVLYMLFSVKMTLGEQNAKFKNNPKEFCQIRS